jgi:hypothetical protein
MQKMSGSLPGSPVRSCPYWPLAKTPRHFWRRVAATDDGGRRPMKVFAADDSGDMTTVTLWLFNIAMENGPFMDGLPIRHGDFPWLC